MLAGKRPVNSKTDILFVRRCAFMSAFATLTQQPCNGTFVIRNSSSYENRDLTRLRKHSLAAADYKRLPVEADDLKNSCSACASRAFSVLTYKPSTLKSHLPTSLGLSWTTWVRS